MSTKNLSKAFGFSLIELMVVIAIVALLAAVAVPSYKGYIAKSRTAEINSLAASFMETWSINNDAGTTPSNNTTGVGSYITGVTYTMGTGGYVEFTLDTVNSPLINTNLSGVTLKLTPNVGTNVVTWSCAPVGAPYYPTPGPLGLAGTVC